MAFALHLHHLRHRIAGDIMYDPGALARCLQSQDALLRVAVVHRHPAVLAQVFGPGLGDEMFDEPLWLLHVAEHLPVHRAVAQSNTAQRT